MAREKKESDNILSILLTFLLKVNVWPASRGRSPLYSYTLPPNPLAVLLASRLIFAIYETKVLVMSAHHAAAPAPTKPLQEISLPPGAKLLNANTIGFIFLFFIFPPLSHLQQLKHMPFYGPLMAPSCARLILLLALSSSTS